MKQRARCLLEGCACLALSIRFAAADVMLPSLFSDGMVLQQGMPAPVWGWADEGEKVTVEIQGRQVSAEPRQGKWIVRLDKMNAGGPFQMKVSGKNTLLVNDVLVGEVWVCSGQSNMLIELERCENGAAAVAQSANPKMRFFKVPLQASDRPRSIIPAEWQTCEPATAAGFSAIGYYFGRVLNSSLGVPIGLLESCVSGTGAASWISHAALEDNPAYKDVLDSYAQAAAIYPKALEEYTSDAAEYTKACAEAKAAGIQLPIRPLNLDQQPMGPSNYKRPSALYYGMISPLQPYGIRGVIWYQGESDALRPYQSIRYRTLFPDLIRRWRQDWGQGDFPFLFVQLASYGEKGDPWPATREAQLMTLSVKNTGMAVAVDVGDHYDIHPRKKQTVGERLALIARGLVYGESIEHSGPIFDSMRIAGAKAVVGFKHVAGGLEARDGRLRGFVVAGEDRKFAEASAEIAGQTVEVSSPAVKAPVAVRYGWAAFTTCNLYNKAGLPASPFRTDDWPLQYQEEPRTKNWEEAKKAWREELAKNAMTARN